MLPNYKIHPALRVLVEAETALCGDEGVALARARVLVKLLCAEGMLTDASNYDGEVVLTSSLWTAS